jgi:hypothetical protein
MSARDPDTETTGEPGGRYGIETTDGTVVAEAETLDGLRDEAESLRDAYFIYDRRGRLAEVVRGDLEDAMSAMRSMSYDLWPYAEHWTITHGDEVVFGGGR